MSAPRTLSGLTDVAGNYDAFFIDQFGVLHDGTRPYPGAVATLEALSAAGKRVILLSNSGKRSAPNAARLARLGFGDALYDTVLTSGEVGWSILSEEGALQRCLLIARDGDTSAIDGLPLAATDDAGACDVVLIAGSEADSRSLESYRALLAPAAARGVPAYCTNPDVQMLTPDGLRFGAGQIAELYEELGGTVTWIGKPHPAIYAAAQALLPAVQPERVLCIGDSIDHDIAGAARAGLDSCLIAGGILADTDPDEFDALFAQADAAPDFILSEIRW